MALAELITTRYPKDTLDILVFGNDSWTIDIKDLPYLKVGPLPHKHCCRSSISNGFIAKKKKHQQTDLYDYRWKTKLS